MTQTWNQLTSPPTDAVFTLRPYQQECVQRVLEAYELDKHGEATLVLPTGCHRAGQGILMYDGTIKPVEEIRVGDLLMGPDSAPRQVMALCRGQEDMYEISPTKGNPWVVNTGHMLSLVRTKERTGDRGVYPSTQGGTLCEVRMSDWLTWSAYKQHVHKLFRVGVDFPQREPLPVHPYLLGVLLGDGGLSIETRIQITSVDEPALREVERIITTSGMHLHFRKHERRAPSSALVGRVGKGNVSKEKRVLKTNLRNMGLFPIQCEDRFIPHMYKTASRQDRRELLAGLIDTDGHCDRAMFEYISKSQRLADDVLFVARSLGLAAYKTLKPVNGVTYYRVLMSGDCSSIPTRIPRKQASVRQQKKDVLRTGFTCKPTGTVEEYYGFTLDGDGRYLLDDFTVTHNSGKTLIFCQVIHQLHTNTLVIAHRDELLDQAAEKYRLVQPDALIGKVGSGRHEYGGEVTVASIATISRPEHLRRLRAIGYGLVIVDESHHSAAAGYQAVLAALPEAFVLKVTATPDRLDGKDSTNGKPPVYSASIIDMIAQGYLCDVKAIAIRTETSLDGLHTELGDYKTGELEAAVDTPARNRRVVEAYQEYAPGRRAICFAVTVAHASHLADVFHRTGVAAAMVCGDTPLDERKRLYQGLRDGTIKVLSNVQVLTEGFDECLVDCIIMARPTQSRALFVQSMGRGLRLAPTKQDCLLLDLTDNCLKHRLEPQTLQKALGKAMKDQESLLEALAREEQEREVARKAAATTVVRTLKEMRTADLSINLLERLLWREREDGTYLLEVGGEKHRIELVPSSHGYSVWAYLAPVYARQCWMQDAPLDWAQQYAEQQARVLLTKKNATVLVDRHAPWRTLPVDPQSPQAFHLQRFKVPNWWTLTKGEASDILGPLFDAERKERQATKARANQKTGRDVA